MSSGIRTFANEYIDDDSGQKIGFLHIVQVGRANKKQGVSFHIKGSDFLGKEVQTSVTLETEQIKLLVSDLINKLSGGIHQDQANEDLLITEKQASKINYQTQNSNEGVYTN